MTHRHDREARRHHVGVTPWETLIDMVVHGQDIALPLGRHLVTPVESTAATADRLWWLRATRDRGLESKVLADSAPEDRRDAGAPPTGGRTH